MDYIKQLEVFYSTLDYSLISADAIALYNLLLHIAFKTDWTNEFSVANTTLTSKLKITTKRLQIIRNELITKKYIAYRKGSNQNNAPRYCIIKLYRENDAKFGQAEGQATEQADGHTTEQAEGQATGYIITILYLLFNYINKGENAFFFKDISESQRLGIRSCLKELGVLAISDDIFKYYDEEKMLEIEIQYYVIKELYFSPYKVILGKLTKEEFMLKFLKTKKYVNIQQDGIHKFINYFIKSLKEKVDRGFSNDENSK